MLFGSVKCWAKQDAGEEKIIDMRYLLVLMDIQSGHLVESTRLTDDNSLLKGFLEAFWLSKLVGGYLFIICYIKM